MVEGSDEGAVEGSCGLVGAAVWDCCAQGLAVGGCGLGAAVGGCGPGAMAMVGPCCYLPASHQSHTPRCSCRSDISTAEPRCRRRLGLQMMETGQRGFLKLSHGFDTRCPNQVTASLLRALLFDTHNERSPAAAQKPHIACYATPISNHIGLPGTRQHSLARIQTRISTMSLGAPLGNRL